MCCTRHTLDEYHCILPIHVETPHFASPNWAMRFGGGIALGGIQDVWTRLQPTCDAIIPESFTNSDARNVMVDARWRMGVFPRYPWTRGSFTVYSTLTVAYQPQSSYARKHHNRGNCTRSDSEPVIRDGFTAVHQWCHPDSEDDTHKHSLCTEVTGLDDQSRANNTKESFPQRNWGGFRASGPEPSMQTNATVPRGGVPFLETIFLLWLGVTRSSDPLFHAVTGHRAVLVFVVKTSPTGWFATPRQSKSPNVFFQRDVGVTRASASDPVFKIAGSPLPYL